ncbi:MAG: chromosomal replication initiator protein DnaA [Chloroflexota bacterium]
MLSTAREVWEATLGELQVQVSKSNYRTWLEKTKGISYADDVLVIGVPNAFVAEYLETNQRSLIEKALFGLTSPQTRVVFRVNGHHPEEKAPESAPASGTPPTAARYTGFNPKYVFNSYIAGTNNRLARAAALAVAQQPGHTYNPLFIYGGVGLGKTHLLHAVGHWAADAKIKALCITAEKFTNEYVSAIREHRMEDFHQKYRNADMLLVDDIQFISGKEQTEETFFHTFNELHNANRQIVITSDRSPKEMPQITERLRSRFEWGLIVDIQPPDYETRLAILQAKAAEKDIPVPQDVLEFLAEQDQSNVREIEGSLNRVLALARLLRAKPDRALAARATENIATKKPAAAPSAAQVIINAVAAAFQLSSATLTGAQRDKEAVTARRIAMYLLRRETNLPLARIGQEMGGRDAAAVTNAGKKISRDLETNTFLRNKIKEIQQKMHKPEAK